MVGNPFFRSGVRWAGSVSAVVALFSLALFFAVPLHSGSSQPDASHDPRLRKAYRFQQGGWMYVHLEGSPSEIGFQHGYLLAP